MDRAVVQNLIAQLGQSQHDRLAPELDAHHADVDDRSPERLLDHARRFAEFVRYYEASGESAAAAGDWRPFFPAPGESLGALVARGDGRVPPHLALYLAFLELYKTPQALANAIGGRHLDFYYQDVLRLRKRGPVPDRAHVLLELKKGAAPQPLTPDHLFTAGKDATGVELLYAPVRDTVIGAARVESLRSIHVERSGRGAVRFAPIANSADGLGAPLAGDGARWFAFGHAGLPRAEVGFAIAAPVLRMREGTRRVTVRLRVAGASAALAAVNGGTLDGAFAAFVTGDKGWVEGAGLVATGGGDGDWRWEFTLPPTAPPVVDYDAATHGYAYAAAAPVVQLLLRADAPASALGYLALAPVAVQSARVSVDVSGVTSLAAESDAGALDAKKTFLPFGPEPTAGSRLMVGYPEALAKRLLELRLTVRWKDAPTSFGTHYAAYGVSNVMNASFTAAARFADGAGTEFTDTAVALFDSADARAARELRFVPGVTASAPASSATDAAGLTVRALSAAGSAWAAGAARRHLLASPVLVGYRRPAPPPPREGFVTLALNRGFLHAEYRQAYVRAVMAHARSGGTLTLPNEPYTPSVQALSLAYRAQSDEVRVSSDALADFANPDIQFFHVAPFGPAREHGYARRRFAFLAEPDVRLLPQFPDDGELLVGVAGAGAGDAVSLLFQVAPGSADPDLAREPVSWSVLCDNYWRPLAPGELALDTTNGLLASGIVRVVLPAETTTGNTLLPAGPAWLKGSARRNVTAVSQLVAVAANAAEVRLVDRGNDPAHLERALPAASLTKLKTPLAAVKSVAQPYASFGGAPAEGGRAFATRVSERLRHKNRCLTAWDYERVVLQAFPDVHKVKCVPHARDGSWTAPGHVLLVVVPDLRNRNAVDPLRPRVDADTLARVEAHVRARAGAQVRVRVQNPRYQKVRLEFAVRFRAGREFNYYRGALDAALVRVLSPWAFDAEREIAFGGGVYKSVLMNFVEELPYVDYVTDFRMYTFAGDVADRADVTEARPATPDAILVSDASHTITAAV